MNHPDQLGADLLAVLARVHRWATGQADLPVPSAQARLLALIDATGPARVSELAIADHSSQPTMTNQLHRFREQGWINRSPDPLDARAVLVSLSERGARMLAASRQARHAAIAPRIAELGTADRRRLVAAVDILRELADGLPTVRATAAATAPAPATATATARAPASALASATASAPAPAPSGTTRRNRE